jgi:UDP-N-acetylmuramoylalanine--D-glutamate ligase
MNSAVQISYLNAKKDNQHASIILSPAAASFDQYKNFETRGNAFKRIVSNL